MKLQISLRRMLLFVAFVAAAIGCIRVYFAFADDPRYDVFLVLGLFFVGSAAGIFCKQPLAAGYYFVFGVLFIVVLVGFLVRFILPH